MIEWLCIIHQLIRVSESDRAALCADAETFSCNAGDDLSTQFVFDFKKLNVLHTQHSVNLSTLLERCQCSLRGGGGGDDDGGDDTYPRTKRVGQVRV